VRNEETHLPALLQRLTEQDADPETYEIIVVDGLSEDRTREVVHSFQHRGANVRLLDNVGILSACGRNVGARHARGRYLLFIDGHCRIPSRGMLSAVIAAFAAGERCLSRPQPLIDTQVEPMAAAVALARKSWLGHYAGSQIFSRKSRRCNPLSAGCGYGKSLYDELGGTDESFDAGEDLEFNYRVHRHGITALHAEDFTVEYFPRSSFAALFRQMYRYSYGRARMARKHPRSFTLVTLAPSLLLTMAAALPLAATAWPAFWKLWGSGLVVYAGLCAGTAVWQARGRSLATTLRVAFGLPVIHLGAGFGFIAGLVGAPSWSQRAAARRRADRKPDEAAASHAESP